MEAGGRDCGELSQSPALRRRHRVFTRMALLGWVCEEMGDVGRASERGRGRSEGARRAEVGVSGAGRSEEGDSGEF